MFLYINTELINEQPMPYIELSLKQQKCYSDSKRVNIATSVSPQHISYALTHQCNLDPPPDTFARVGRSHMSPWLRINGLFSVAIFRLYHLHFKSFLINAHFLVRSLGSLLLFCPVSSFIQMFQLYTFSDHLQVSLALFSMPG